MKTPSHLSLSHLNRLRAAVLGANDGIVSTASVIMGVVGAGVDNRTIFVAGMAALVAGAFSMAIGEYVSVASQKDAEMAHRARRGGAAEYTSPTQAAAASFLAFSVGGVVPLGAVMLATTDSRIVVTVVAVIVALLLTGYFSATAGKASRPRAMSRILIGGLLAMAATYGVGSLFGTVI